MNKVFTPILLIFAFMLTIPAASAFAEGMPEGRMNVPELAPFKYAPAVFDHDPHNEKAGLEENCIACHHGGENGKMDMEDDTSGTPCVECHSVEKQRGVTPLRRAFHLQCITCHENQNKGPVQCKSCHVPEK
ncbi:acidic tetraheme cytochrome c3 TmcA [Halodesulfovibrio spirochaetisodalis]|uniref:Class III cytochrome C domain-containing protein n=1 Tax=Halodesulfovibrio spirochaetisodalis TaxID=1560234 RepID=A0A1B7X9Q7_9BACT|nr:cytochrome c3 family protein [Halodesulfovibrio spirochaetisodalis]OBQ46114.1 hypothetical protein SP90_14610 [Halodesulfovibrio spirochaetisodalis]